MLVQKIRVLPQDFTKLFGQTKSPLSDDLHQKLMVWTTINSKSSKHEANEQPKKKCEPQVGSRWLILL